MVARERVLAAVARAFARASPVLPWLCAVAWVAGFVWLSLLPTSPQRAYISENALLVNEGARNYDRLEAARAASLRRELAALSGVAWIDHVAERMHAAHAEVSAVPGSFVSALWRTPRIDGTEALLLVTDSDARSVYGGDPLASAAFAVTLAEYFAPLPWLARDIVLVVANGTAGLAEWARQYSAGRIINAEVFGAFVLRLESLSVERVALRIVSPRGGLPNLDLVNTLTFLDSGLPIVLDHGPASFVAEPLRRYLTPAQHGAAVHLASLAADEPTDLHSVLHPLGIEAVTLHCRTVSQTADTAKLGRLLEGAMRSLSNAIEKLHQSFYFYFMPGLGAFVSIGLYMPTMLFVSIGIAIVALTQHIAARAELAHTSVTALMPLLLAAACGLASGVAPRVALDLGYTSVRALVPAAVTVQLVLVVAHLAAQRTCQTADARRVRRGELEHMRACISSCLFVALLYLSLQNFAQCVAASFLALPFLIASPARHWALRVVQLLVWTLWSPVVVLYALGALDISLAALWRNTVLSVVLHSYVALYSVCAAPLLLGR